MFLITHERENPDRDYFAEFVLNLYPIRDDCVENLVVASEVLASRPSLDCSRPSLSTCFQSDHLSLLSDPTCLLGLPFFEAAD